MSEGLSILLIEDNDGSANYIKTLLGSTLCHFPNSSITVSRRLKESILLIRTNSPSLVLLDLSLEDSPDPMSTIMNFPFESSPPTIVITGHSDEKLAAAASKAGAVGFIRKDDAFSPSARRMLDVIVGLGTSDGWRKRISEIYSNIKQLQSNAST